MRRALFFVMLSATLFLAARSAHAQTSASRCADCHFANPTAPRRDHLEEWDRSPHGRNNVGCEKCHGGNDRVFDKLPAHMGILASSNRFSPVNRRVSIIVMNKKAEEAASKDGGTLEVDEPSDVSKEALDAAQPTR